MDSEDGIRLRKLQALRPIQTKPIKEMPQSSDHDDHFLKEEEEEPLSPAGRLFLEPTFNLHVIAIMGCKTKIHPDVVKANLPLTLLKHPRFSSLLDKTDGGTEKWVRTKVDLDKHIIIPDMDSNMKSSSSGDKYLEDYIYNLTKTPMDKSRPLWDLHLLNIKTSEAESCFLSNTLMSLLLACTRQISNPEALPTIPTAAKKKNGGPTEIGFVGRMWRCFLGVWWVLQLLRNTFVDILVFIATALFLKDTQTPIKGPPGSELKPRQIVFKIVSLDDMKLIKNAMDVTINDVAVGITQAGLSKYLNRRYGLDQDNKNTQIENNNNLPNKIRLRSILFFNIRPSVGIQVCRECYIYTHKNHLQTIYIMCILQALADMMEKNTKAKWGNSFGYVVLPFTIALMDDPLDYIRQAKATIDRKRHSLEALCTFSIVGLIYKFLGIKKASAFFQRLFTSTTVAFSNVVGPLEELGFYSHPMAYIAATTFGQANELMVHFQSYVNKMTIVLSVDENTIPNPHQLIEDIAESLKLIKDFITKKELAN
ncbi:hypothetical protein UlMin_010188 [Ulmus minor]